VSALVLDAGALIAIDRGDPDVITQVERAFKSSQPVRTNAMAIAHQRCWRPAGAVRGGGEQGRGGRLLTVKSAVPAGR